MHNQIPTEPRVNIFSRKEAATWAFNMTLSDAIATLRTMGYTGTHEEAGTTAYDNPETGDVCKIYYADPVAPVKA